MLDNGMKSHPYQDSAKFHHTAQKNAQFKTYKLFTSRIPHLIFLYSVGAKTFEVKPQRSVSRVGGTFFVSIETLSWTKSY